MRNEIKETEKEEEEEDRGGEEGGGAASPPQKYKICEKLLLVFHKKNLLAHTNLSTKKSPLNLVLRRSTTTPTSAHLPFIST